MHTDISQEPFNTRTYSKKAVLQERDNHCVRACAVEMQRTSNLTKAILRENLKEKCRGPDGREHPDLTPALTPTARTPQCGHSVWGKGSPTSQNDGLWSCSART